MKECPLTVDAWASYSCGGVFVSKLSGDKLRLTDAGCDCQIDELDQWLGDTEWEGGENGICVINYMEDDNPLYITAGQVMYRDENNCVRVVKEGES